MKNSNYLLCSLLLTLFFSNLQAQINERELIFNYRTSNDVFTPIDINGDGLMDLSGFFDLGFEAYLNKGDFKFSSSGVFKFDESAEDLNLGKFQFIDSDGDGDQDLLYAGCSACLINEILLFENVDGTSFENRGIVYEEFGGFVNTNFAVADFDNDGDQDFVLTETDFSDIEIFFGENNNGNFSVSSIYVGEDIGGFGWELFTQDLNADGRMDVVGQSGGNIYLINNLVSGFETPIALNGGNVFLHQKEINGDGILDLFYTDGDCLKVMLSENGSFAVPEDFYCGENTDTEYFLQDSDGDGDLDIFHGRSVNSGLYFIENDNGEFLTSQQISVTGHELFRTFEMDANNDGRMDLFSVGDGSYLGCLEKINNNEFGLSHTVASVLNPRNVNPFQIDLDSTIEISVFYDDWVGYIDPVDDDYQGVKTIYNSDVRITDVAYSDLDEDGDADLILLFEPEVTSQVDPTIVWLENNNQVFSNPQNILTDYHDGSSIQVADFDLDGDVDIAVFSMFEANIYLENNGNATFVESDVLGATSWDSRVKDVNEDGWPDLISWNNVSRVYYHENDQQGGFNPRKTVGGSNSPRHVDAYDFDQDGDQDFLVTYSSRISIFENNNGNFGSEMIIDENQYYSAEIVDLYYENKPGFIGGWLTKIWTHDEGLEFSPRASNAFSYYTQMFFKDFDHSGSTDLIAYETNSTISGLYIHRNIQRLNDADNDGFPSTVDCNDNNPDINPGAMEIPNNSTDENCDEIVLVIDEDMDGFNSSNDCNDMDPEINPDAIEIPFNGVDEDCNGVDTPDYFTQVAELDFDGRVGDVDLADLNGDGVNDIIAASWGSVIWTNYPFTSPVNVVDEFSGAQFDYVAQGDMDEDGDIDMIIYEGGADAIYFSANNGDGSFQNPVLIGSELVLANSLEVGDMDNDGHLDVLIIARGVFLDNDVFIYYGTGTGSFEAVQNPVEEAQLLASLYLYDIDGDDDLDIFTTNWVNDGKIRWNENEGNRVFSEEKIICESCNRPENLFIADYDQDNILELVAINQSPLSTPNDISVGIQSFEWNGSAFQYSEEISSDRFLGNIFPIDMDQDCLLDIVTGGRSSKPRIFFNSETEGFNRFGLNVNQYRILDMVAEDLNGDGYPELIFGALQEKILGVIINETPDADNDGDGFDTSQDCDDCNPDINPDAIEIIANGIDEDCNGSDLITSVHQLGNAQIRIFPNPTQGIISIEHPENLQFEMILYNVLGQHILTKVNTSSLDLSAFTNGIYILAIEDLATSEKVLEKIILEKSK